MSDSKSDFREEDEDEEEMDEAVSGQLAPVMKCYRADRSTGLQDAEGCYNLCH